MNTGMLWFDNDPKTDLSAKISRAMHYYQNKYGQAPNLCFIHPSMLKSSPAAGAEIELRSSKAVLPNHFWLGVHTVSAPS